MAKADRLDRLDRRRIELETEYREALEKALRHCAAGHWGLFDHKQDRAARASVAPIVDELLEMGGAIDAMRTQLGMAPFTLHREFAASRGPVSPSAVGEPKQAQAWLSRLEQSGPA